MSIPEERPSKVITKEKRESGEKNRSYRITYSGEH